MSLLIEEKQGLTQKPYDFQQNQFVILVKNQGSYGDILGGYKLAMDLHERLGILKKNICITTKYPSDFSNLHLHQFTVIGLKEKLPFSITTKIVQIKIPCEIGVSEELRESVPLIAFSEYNFRANHSPNIPLTYYQGYALGLPNPEQEDAIGIPLDQKLIEFSVSDKAGILQYRLEQLQKVRKGLQQAILNNRTIEKFGELDTLYFGYASISCLFAYISAISKLNSNSNKCITIVFPVAHRKYERWGFSNNFLWKSHFQGDPIQSIFLSKYDVEKDQIESTAKVFSEQEGISIHLILGTITHEDMRHLWLASEPESVATGDQTFSEAVSSNKCFIYQTELHKRDFNTAITHVVFQALPENEARECPIAPPWNSKISSDSLYTYFSSQREKQFRDSTRINKFICKNYDYWPKMQDILDKALRNRINYQGILFIDEPTPETMPFDTPIITSLKNISRLKINTDSNCSSLDIWKDTIFSAAYLPSDSYFLIRKRKNLLPEEKKSN